MKTGLTLPQVMEGLERGKHRYTHVYSSYRSYGQLDQFRVTTLTPLTGGRCDASQDFSMLDSDGHTTEDATRVTMHIRDLFLERLPAQDWIESPLKASR